MADHVMKRTTKQSAEEAMKKDATSKNGQQHKIDSRTLPLKAISSPFLVDLAKDVARVENDSKVRLKEDKAARLKSFQQIEQAKNGLILRALQEGNEIENLRKHKRKLMEEEKRLKALIEIEKTNGHRKEDRQAAQRAEQTRRHFKLESRLKKNRETIEIKRQAKMNLLATKLNLPTSNAKK